MADCAVHRGRSRPFNLSGRRSGQPNTIHRSLNPLCPFRSLSCKSLKNIPVHKPIIFPKRQTHSRKSGHSAGPGNSDKKCIHTANRFNNNNKNLTYFRNILFATLATVYSIHIAYSPKTINFHFVTIVEQQQALKNICI